GSVASQMESMRIIAADLAGKQNTPLRFLLANSPRLHLLDAALRFGSWQEGPDASAPAAKY
ncbi:hypothetical protein, partial [Pseudomonas syringae]|uniref:hypothetical protein n=1 Tax=Pseudomonas syringae TaxID=317 RepID=UPI001604C271